MRRTWIVGPRRQVFRIGAALGRWPPRRHPGRRPGSGVSQASEDYGDQGRWFGEERYRPEGILGYLRLMHLDNQGERDVARTCSPSLDDLDSEDPSLDLVHQEFEIPYAAVGIDPVTKTPVSKTPATDGVRADILTQRTMAELRGVPSGATRSVRWDVGPGVRGWFGGDDQPLPTPTADGRSRRCAP